MNKLNRKDWWWINPEIGGTDLSNRTTKSLKNRIVSSEFALNYTSCEEQLKKDRCYLEELYAELTKREDQPREGDIF